MENLTEEQFLTLEIIAGHSEPVGSGTISAEITGKEKNISEATAGRILRKLDNRGYTRKMGFRGRIITDKGLRIYNNYKEDREKEKQLLSLLRISKIDKKKDLLDLLKARRAIERELAGMAAEDGSRHYIGRLENIIESHARRYKQGLSGVNEDLKFHDIIAVMADNRFLRTALNFIMSESDGARILEFIRSEVGSILIKDHRRILTALKSGSTSDAEKAMVIHIDNLIGDVNKYWSQINPGNGDVDKDEAIRDNENR